MYSSPAAHPAVAWVPGQERDRDLRAYYRYWNEHPPNRDVLTALFDQLDALLVDESDPAAILLRPLAVLGADIEPVLVELSEDPDEPEDGRVRHRAQLQSLQRARRARALLQDFAAQHHLPVDVGPEDLAYSYLGRRLVGTALMVAPRWTPPSPLRTRVASEAIGYVPQEEDGPAILVDERASRLSLHLSIMLDYDPTRDTRAQLRLRLDELCEGITRDIRAALLAQAKGFEQELHKAGFRPPGPRARAPEHSEQVARRLFQRAVLGWRWPQIADWENEEGSAEAHSPDEDAIRITTTKAAHRLHIPL